MDRLQALRSLLVGGASLVALSQPALAREFDVPRGDLASALNIYSSQANVQLIYSDKAVRGHQTGGAKGNYTEFSALDRVLTGTGFKAETTASSAVGIVPDAPKLPKRPLLRVAAATTVKSGGTVETVTVTAEKIHEDIQNVPIAVTALSQKQLTERQIASGPDLVKEVPNLTFSKTNFTGYNLEIRGIGTQAISVTTDPAVAVAFNGIPFIRNHFFEQEFYDLDNLEVLRGPQGTLYGRNATAGVVNILSAKPTDSYESSLSVDYGNYNNRRLEGMLNIPIVGDTLDLRIAGEWTKRDGYSFNSTLNSSIDGRDLWSGRATLGWKPTPDIQAYLVWEHFSEDDNRLRSGKQLCRTDPTKTAVGGVGLGAPGDYLAPADYVNQGCIDTSLYSPSAFEVPNGYSLAYFTPLQAAGLPDRAGTDPYAETTQSLDLRSIQSATNPTYRAKNDTVELNVDYQVTPKLTITSQTGYNSDYLRSTEDYDRFDSAPGVFVSSPGDFIQNLGIVFPDPNAGKNGVPADAAGFCDPQLGCNDRLVLEDLSEEHAWQLGQEFRVASSLDGPFNFSVGVNYLHYETEENYYVFVNTLTMISALSGGLQWVPNVTDNSPCVPGGLKTINPNNVGGVLTCRYIDPNRLSSLNNEGHNYFLSQNPYVLNSYAGFGEAYYTVTDDLKLTAGVRWTDDNKHFVDIPSELLDTGYGYPTTGVVNQTWDQWTGRLVANWTPKIDLTDQTLVYASIAHGYKAGGANPPGAFFPTVLGGLQTGVVTNPVHPLTFKPEFIEAFELGTKNTLLDGALTLNGDVFYYNYSGYQISQIVDRTSVNLNFNAHVEGAELESSWEPLPGLRLSFAGGYENSALAGGSQAVDLMDRTAGNPNWVVVKPYLTTASNCILPTYVVAATLETGATSPFYNICSVAYGAQLDPATHLPYGQGLGATPPGYPGFDPSTAPNNGEGFFKNLAGNQLPNAPHFTASFTAEETFPVGSGWAATVHADFYYASQQWARVFEDQIDKIRGYSTTNLSFILNSDDGWQVMAYLKNVFNVTAITGTFLNSDDTGLTSNVFLTDPRLFGVRVTKHLDEGDGLWGSRWSGSDLITGLFSDTDKAIPTLWVELGGGFANMSDSSEPFAPAFLSEYAANGLISPIPVENPPHYGFDKDISVMFQPTDSDWVLTASVRFGRTGTSAKQHQQFKNAFVPVNDTLFSQSISYSMYPTNHVKFADASSVRTESHTVIDFMAGKDVGLGMLGFSGSSVFSAGFRMAQFVSRSHIHMNGEPDLQYPTAPITSYAQKYAFKHAKIHFHDNTATADNLSSFRGIGPKLDWRASTPVDGDEDTGLFTFDWGLNGSLLFGRQKASGHHQTTIKSFYLTQGTFAGPPSQKIHPGHFHNFQICQNNNYSNECGVNPPPTNQQTNSTPHNRSRMVVVPNLGAFVGMSVKYRNARVSFGYQADEFFGAIDGGVDSRKSYDRGFFGPFVHVSVGLGG